MLGLKHPLIKTKRIKIMSETAPTLERQDAEAEHDALASMIKADGEYTNPADQLAAKALISQNREQFIATSSTGEAVPVTKTIGDSPLPSAERTREEFVSKLDPGIAQSLLDRHV
jgi:hypothetical protein